jgi:hypothetical protein
VSLVTLSWREVRLAAFAGIDRRIMHLYQRTTDHHGRPSRDRGWEIDIQGALGEFVIAKLFDIYWSGGMPKRECIGDVGRHQVRASTLDHAGLIIYEDDADDVPFILVVGVPPRFRVPGWMTGGEAKQSRWWRADLHDPAYLVPQLALHPVEDFVDPNLAVRGHGPAS